MLSLYQLEFAKLLEKQLGILSEVIIAQIVLAPENVEGDLAFPCFRIAKDFAKNPSELAKDLAEALNNVLPSPAADNQIFSFFVAV
jgi:arginyl-tRNA synthetase